MTPGAAGTFVQFTVMLTVCWSDPVAPPQVFAKLRWAGVGLLVTFQTLSCACEADMSFDSSCGAISFTGIETSFDPMPDVLRFWFSRLACSDEPGKRWDPSASRPYQS